MFAYEGWLTVAAAGAWSAEPFPALCAPHTTLARTRDDARVDAWLAKAERAKRELESGKAAQQFSVVVASLCIAPEFVTSVLAGQNRVASDVRRTVLRVQSANSGSFRAELTENVKAPQCLWRVGRRSIDRDNKCASASLQRSWLVLREPLANLPKTICRNDDPVSVCTRSHAPHYSATWTTTMAKHNTQVMLLAHGSREVLLPNLRNQGRLRVQTNRKAHRLQ